MQAAFTPKLYAMLLHDMSDPGGVGYLDANPFTDAQDFVPPPRFEDVHESGDTLMIRFSREGDAPRRDSITLAMRNLGGTWRIANFNTPCGLLAEYFPELKPLLPPPRRFFENEDERVNVFRAVSLAGAGLTAIP